MQKGADSVEDIVKFVQGEASPFNTPVGDAEGQKLVERDDELNEILCPMLQGLFLAMSQLLNRMVHLPGGKFSQPSEELIRETKSVMKHNKLPEFVFGQLDQLLRYRPNATLLTNEAYLMYSHNKTREWLESLPDEERNKLIDNARKQGKSARMKFKERLRAIEAKRLEIQEERKRKLEVTEQKRRQELEELTNNVCYYGLWQSIEQVNEGLATLDTENEKREALQAQLKFRRKVLNQKHQDSKVYNFTVRQPSGKYMKLTIDEMKTNVIKLIQDCLVEPTSEKHRRDIPLFVGKEVSHKFADGKTYKGYVISMVPGYSEWYNLKYENNPSVYSFNLVEEYKNGDLQLRV